MEVALADVAPGAAMSPAMGLQKILRARFSDGQGQAVAVDEDGLSAVRREGGAVEEVRFWLGGHRACTEVTGGRTVDRWGGRSLDGRVV
jgi:hypothetical protein